MSTLLAACAPVVIGAGDWSTKFRGAGSVETHIWNQSHEPITVRIEDFYGHVVAQSPLEANQREVVYLPIGNVRATVRVIRNGAPRDSAGVVYNVGGDTLGVEWRFFPPPEGTGEEVAK